MSNNWNLVSKIHHHSYALITRFCKTNSLHLCKVSLLILISMPYNKKKKLSITYIAFRLKKYEYSAVFPNSLSMQVLVQIKTKQTNKKARTGHKERDNEALYNNMHNNSQQRFMTIFWSSATETEVMLMNSTVSLNPALLSFRSSSI